MGNISQSGQSFYNSDGSLLTHKQLLMRQHEALMKQGAYQAQYIGAMRNAFEDQRQWSRENAEMFAGVSPAKAAGAGMANLNVIDLGPEDYRIVEDVPAIEGPKSE